MDYSQLAIVRCSDAQTVQTRRNHFEQWGKPLGFDEQGWLDRFRAMEDGAWAVADRYVTWALVPRDDSHTLDILAHCETFRRQSILRRPNEDVQHTISYGIASVYTPAKHRGKAYARHILRLIHYVIAPADLLPPYPKTWGPKPSVIFGDASFSVLYSGIGDKYYATCRQGDGPDSKPGWIRLHVTSRTWDVPTEAVELAAGTKLLGLDELEGLESMATREMEAVMTQTRDDSRFAILPSWSLLRIHALRAEASPSARLHPGRPYALVLPSSDNGDASFATFTYPEAPSEDATLRTTYLRHPMPFDAVVAVAQRAGCAKISIWGDRSGWDHVARPHLDHDAEMPCYVVYGHDTEDYTWQEPELYTWC